MKRWLTILIPICLLSGLIFWRIVQNRGESAAQAQMQFAKAKGSARVSLAAAEPRDISRVFEATGSVEAPLNVKIAPKIAGRIEYLEVREGDRVRKGQVLVRIDDSDVEAEVQRQMAVVAEAQYKLAQAQMNQNPADVAVQTQISQQQAAIASAQADYTQSKATYDAQLAAATASITDAQSKVENAKAAVTSAQANLENAKTRYNRIEGLYKQGFIAAQEVDDAKAAVTVQESAVEIAKGQLKSTAAQHEASQQQYNITRERGKADVESAKAKLAQTRASLEYAQANTSQKSAYRQSIQALKASVAAAKASLSSAQTKRRDTVLVSPLDGFVTGRFADPGAIASPTQPVISVQFMKQVWVSIPVPEEVCAKLHIGQPAKIHFDALPKQEFTASIIQINPSADPQNRQFMVRVILSNAKNQFKPGMFARVAIETDRVSRTIAVPREAVQRTPEGAFVTTVDAKQIAKRVPVTLGAEDNEYISVGDSLKPGTKVVIMSSMPVRDGQPVSAGGRGKNGRPGAGGWSGGERRAR